MPTASLTAAVNSQSKPVRIPSESIEVSRISPAPRCFSLARPLDDAAACRFSAALHKDLRIADGIGGFGIAAGIDGDDDGLCAKAAADGVDQSWVGERSGVHAYFVRAGLEDLSRIVCRANAAAYAKGHK